MVHNNYAAYILPNLELYCFALQVNDFVLVVYT